MGVAADSQTCQAAAPQTRGQSLEDRIAKAEGYRPVEQDGHIGYGHNAAAHRRMLNADVRKAERDAKDVIGESIWRGINAERRDALIEITYMTGRAGLRKFKRMLESVRQGDWSAAAGHWLDSKAAEQVGGRAVRIADELSSGRD